MTNLKQIELPNILSTTLLISALQGHAKKHSSKIAIQTSSLALSYSALFQQVELLAKKLRESGIRRFAILEDNSPAWVIADLAGQMVGATVVPVPLFFSREQQQHLVNQSGVQAVLSSQASLLDVLISADTIGSIDVLAGSTGLDFSFYIMMLAESSILPIVVSSSLSKCSN